MDFSWLSEIFNAILSFIPRPVIVRATHGGVKWRFGHKVRELKPGWRWIWPLVTDHEIIVTARQTNNIPSQALITKDGKQVVAASMVIFSIKDVVRAIGQRNWDVGSTVDDITAAATVQVITSWRFNDLLENLIGDVELELTKTCRRRLNQFGVHVHRVCLTDFSTCRTYKLMSTPPPPLEDI